MQHVKGARLAAAPHLAQFEVNCRESRRPSSSLRVSVNFRFRLDPKARASDQFSAGCPLDKLTRPDRARIGIGIRLRLHSGFQCLLPAAPLTCSCSCLFSSHVCVDAIRCRVFCQIYLRFDFYASLQTEVVGPAMS